MYLEDAVTDIKYPILGLETLLNEIEIDICENFGLFIKNDKREEYYRIRGLLEGAKAINMNIKKIQKEYHNIVEKIYKEGLKES